MRAAVKLEFEQLAIPLHLIVKIASSHRAFTPQMVMNTLHADPASQRVTYDYVERSLLELVDLGVFIHLEASPHSIHRYYPPDMLTSPAYAFASKLLQEEVSFPFQPRVRFAVANHFTLFIIPIPCDVCLLVTMRFAYPTPLSKNTEQIERIDFTQRE